MDAGHTDVQTFYLSPMLGSSAAFSTRRGKLFMTGPRIYATALDEELMSWSAKGDRRAFAEIVARHGPFALRMARRLAGEAALAEDLAQEALVRAWTRADRFDPRRARFTTWLYRILVNLCIDERRRLRPAPLPAGFDPPDPAANAEAAVESGERHRALALALSELPARYRAAIALVYDEGMAGAEAAKILGVSAKAVERMLARARASLRSRLSLENDRRDL